MQANLGPVHENSRLSLQYHQMEVYRGAPTGADKPVALAIARPRGDPYRGPQALALSLEFAATNKTAKTNNLRVGLIARELPDNLPIPRLGALGGPGGFQRGQLFFDPRQAGF